MPLLAVWDRRLHFRTRKRFARSRLNLWSGAHNIARWFTIASMYLSFIHTARAVDGLCHALILAAYSQHFPQRTTDASASRGAPECLVRANAKQLSYEQHRSPNPVAQEHEKDIRLTKSPPHSCACCARVLSALLYSAVCVQKATSAL